MKPWTTVAVEPAVDGDGLVLQERDGVYVIRASGRELMSSARHESEEAMAALGLHGITPDRPSVLIGGLGLGFTLRAALDRLPSNARVVVAEISESVVAWNRGPLAALVGAPLDDRRVAIETTDIAQLVATTAQRFDAILLDVDNGPVVPFRPTNQRLYGPVGLAAFRRVLTPGGVLVVWSASRAPRFVESLRRTGFEVREEQVTARKGRGAQHTLFLARTARAKRLG